MRPQSLMNFALRCVRIFPGVNSRAELVTLAPGLRPERRFAPLARGQTVKTNLPYTSSCSIFKSGRWLGDKRSKQTCHILHHVPYLNQILKKLFFVLCNLSYIYFCESLPFALLTVISDDDHPSLVTHARDI